MYFYESCRSDTMNDSLVRLEELVASDKTKEVAVRNSALWLYLCEFQVPGAARHT